MFVEYGGCCPGQHYFSWQSCADLSSTGDNFRLRNNASPWPRTTDLALSDLGPGLPTASNYEMSCIP